MNYEILVVIKTKIQVKGYLDNITDNEHIIIDSQGIKDKYKISYHEDNTINTIKIKEDVLILIRENDEFQNVLIFDPKKQTISNYYIKENDLKLELTIMTNNLNITEKNITVMYTVIESNCEYEYHIELRDKK